MKRKVLFPILLAKIDSYQAKRGYLPDFVFLSRTTASQYEITDPYIIRHYGCDITVKVREDDGETECTRMEGPAVNRK